jgi:ADP-L-glycero-D-manno-heptose 6-epimerase
MDKEKCIVVTGGAGFIGSCVLKELNDRGITNIVVVDSLGTSFKWKNLVGKKFLDLLHKDQLFDWLRGKESQVESILHLGACSSTVEQNAHYLLENNYRYTKRLAEWALSSSIRFVYASSAATYGDGKEGFSDRHDLLESLKPLNMYGYSKHLVDLWLHREGLLGSVAGLKYFNVFGPNEWHKGRMASAICQLVPKIQKEGFIELFESNDAKIPHGEQTRDFIYVKDAARMTCDILFSKATGIYNIGTGKASSWNDLADGIFQALSKKRDIRYIPMPKDLVGTYQNYTCADMTKYAQERQQVATMSFQKAVVDYVTHHLIEGRYL